MVGDGGGILVDGGGDNAIDLHFHVAEHIGIAAIEDSYIFTCEGELSAAADLVGILFGVGVIAADILGIP